MSARTLEPGKFDAIIVGAGVGGLYAIHRLRKLGLKVRAFEAAAGVGGTWYWNRYPGCRCDVESIEYSYSFSDELQQEWHWPERYGTQPEILRYINHVADRFDLRRDIEFNTRVKEAVFDSKTNTWTVRTDNGNAATARYCIMATGNLSTPRKPNLPGLESFKGKWYHTGLWPHEGVDFTGLRVGVIGTGSSGVQSIPIIAKQAKHLYVFQRTANFSLPARNVPIASRQRKRAQSRISRATARRLRYAIRDCGVSAAGKVRARRSRRGAAPRLRGKMGRGRQHQLSVFVHRSADQQRRPTKRLRSSSAGKSTPRSRTRKTAELLCPNDHPIGTKRLILDTDYYETYNRDNVTLVDIRSKPIQEITPTGLRTADADYALDAIVFATGFDAMTGAMKEIDIHTDAGLSVREKWEHGPRTYLGIMIAGLPKPVHDYRPAEPWRQKPDDIGLRATCRLDR